MKRIIAIIEIIAIICVMCVGVLSTSMVANAEAEKGLKFEKDVRYVMANSLESVPLTIETDIKLEKGKGGAILSNYNGYYPCMRLEVISGKLRFFSYDSYTDKGNTAMYYFETPVDTGDWINIAIVRNFPERKMMLYLDGELKETIQINEEKGFVGEKNLVIGDEPYYWHQIDNRFQGVMKSIKLYSDMRTADEIKADMTSLDKSALLTAYDMSEIVLGEQANTLEDLSDNNNDAKSTVQVGPKQGLGFTEDAKYILESDLGAAPITVEATIWLGSDITTSAGSIFSNYNSYNPCFKLEVVAGGKLRYYSYDSTTYTGNNFNYYCSTPINLSRWVNIAFVRDFSANKVYFYIDGELVQTLNATETVALTSGSKMVIGSEHYQYQGISPHFKGKIKDLKVYSDVRTAEEVKADMISLDKSNLLAAYDMSDIYEGDLVNYLPDLSDNSNDAVSTNQQLPAQGMKFGGDTKYILESALPTEPITYEATIWLPKNQTAEGGSLLSNYNSYNPCNSFGISSNGCASFYSYDAYDSTGTVVKYYATKSAAIGEWVHVTMVRDYQAKEIRFYYDGVLVTRKTLNETSAPIGAYNWMVGDEYYYYNNDPANFTGKIKDIKVYSDVRTQDEIKADMTSLDKDNLLIAYDMSEYNTNTKINKITDLSDNSNDAVNSVDPLPLEGLGFKSNTQYRIEKTLSAVPNTFEFEIMIPEGKTGNCGPIISNYNGYNPSMKFEVLNGVVRYYSYDKVGTGGTDVSYFFNTKINTGKWHKIAITRDYAAKEMKFYLDGVLTETKALNETAGLLGADNLIVGSEYQSWGTNPPAFTGKMKSFKMYSDVRTEEEIKNDFTSLDKSDLLVAYDMASYNTYNAPDYLLDLSDNKNNANDLYKGLPQYGLAGNWNRFYDMETVLPELPRSFEFTICVPKGDTGLRTIISNYSSFFPEFQIRINAGKVEYNSYDAYDGLGNFPTYTFSQNVATGKYVHIAIVRDIPNKMMHLYVDGVFSETLTLQSYDEGVIGVYPLRIGEPRIGNGSYFVGKIKDIRIYSDRRVYDEVKKDAVATPDQWSHDNLIFAYDFSSVENHDSPEMIYDLSSNKLNANIVHDFLEEAPEVGEFDYSFAVIGDTQYAVRYFPDRVDYIFDWLVDNKDEHKIKYAMHMGDITDTSAAAEWEYIIPQIKKLDHAIPYSLVCGNHDTAATFNQYCNYANYTNSFDGMYNGKLQSTWRELVIGDMKYIIFTLDYAPAQEELDWAAGIIEAYPNHNIIITTHSYISSFGDISRSNIWETFKKYNNVSMFLCGHEYTLNIVRNTSTGTNGNVIESLMVDPQDLDYREPYGLIAMLYFQDGGKRVQVRYYSTYYNKWFSEVNQFEMNVHAIHQKGDINTDGNVNAGDTVVLKKAVIGKDCADKYSVASCDMNGDGVRDVRDLIRFKRFLAGLKGIA